MFAIKLESSEFLFLSIFQHVMNTHLQLFYIYISETPYQSIDLDVLPYNISFSVGYL